MAMDKDRSKEILEYLKRIDESINGPRDTRGSPRETPPLSDRVDEVEKTLGALDRKIGTNRRNPPLAVQLDALETGIGERFDSVDRSIASTRVEIVDLVTRVHYELTKRVIALETPLPDGKGSGGRGSGGGGVPLAS
jgi:hypothetical protein